MGTNNELAKKVGSFQEYVHAECSMDDLSPSKISVDEVHKIAILDIRLMNADRNVANILCQRIPEDPDHFRLVPIDHGYSLRSVCDVAWFDWCWLDWPQTKQPLSKKSKDYILALDVEADARLLQERLGMQNDVLDYFRASCNVLKAGVKAGLTLYDIASEVLCRNDPSGEIPSKLEILTSMASELATSAVHNGRFHHATASLALQEQLATVTAGKFERKFSTPGKARGFVRSISSSVFSQVPSMGEESSFSDELFDTQALKSQEPPPMVQSSQSDNSSNDGYSSSSAPDEYEADDWALAVVALADESMNNDFGRERSTSESSDSSDHSSKLSKSPVGFWYVRPGSSTFDNESEDDEPVCWTPSLTPSNPPGTLLNVGPPHVLSSGGLSTSNLGKLLYESGAALEGFSLDDETSQSNLGDDFDSSLPATVDEVPSNMRSSIASTPLSTNNTIVRSMSYTAFSSAPSHKNEVSKASMFKSTAMPSILPSTRQQDLFRTYFLKFVDLLVVRETERLVHTMLRLNKSPCK
jgi:hypothetical protein